jgi:peptide/nickel transport system permease protein
MFALVIKRIFWMIPTLFIISMITFTIIQLPPGDYLTSYITALEASGETVKLEEVAALRKAYHLDAPPVERYFRWVAGLLKGDMGQSMEWQKPVTTLIGDRLFLTTMISLGTVMFTWMLAVPIGIFSAVRKYSIGDYAFTITSFIGMATPGFLLALVFMYVSFKVFHVSPGGLFSPAYEAANWFPEGPVLFNWGKMGNLLAHLWIPVVMVGVAGTAGMIRVMRGNLLDELGKQYVMTARAKGVGPIKLLFKYPVRVAMNPIVSTIGWQLPHIVSGSVIVAVVLSLPTVGPLLLQALISQDMYLAGSLVMLLSTLTVIGTLISDILLLWVDPRIRYEKTGT